MLFKKKVWNKNDYIIRKEKNKNVIIDVKDLVLSFENNEYNKKSKLVIRNISFSLYENETLAIIGESGSGKSVLTSTLFGLPGKNAVIEKGTINVLNNNVEKFKAKKWEKSKIRGTGVSSVFQNPMTTLNPTMKIGKQIIEGMLVNKIVKNKKEAKQKAIFYLKATRIHNPEKIMKMYPHELSGGMKQRVVIATIISLKPKVLILDEPTTALDPTVQALVLDIVNDLKKQFKMSVIFITHDLGVVSSIADRIMIMYAGQIVEKGTRDEIMWNPQHPYTWGLLSSMPDINKGERLAIIRGSVPSNLNEIKGDAFATRNPFAMEIDFQKEPPLFKMSETHFAKTWLLDEKAPKIKKPLVIKKRHQHFQKMKEAKE